MYFKRSLIFISIFLLLSLSPQLEQPENADLKQYLAINLKGNIKRRVTRVRRGERRVRRDYQRVKRGERRVRRKRDTIRNSSDFNREIEHIRRNIIDIT